MDSLPSDYFVTSMQFTEHVYRDQYPSIDPTSPELSMAGKVVIITGASRGLGEKGFTRAFAKAGAKALVLVARNADKLKEVAASISQLKPDIDTLVIPADVADPNAVERLYEQVNAKYGHADILINNAAVLQANGMLKDLDPKVWLADFEINSRATFLMTSHFLKSLPKESPGNIINLTSGASYGVYPGMSAYSLGKLINLQMTTYIAAENPNVTAMSLHPGVVDTEMTVDSFKRFALDTPELVAGVAVWLCTEKAKFLNGRYVNSNWSVDDLYKRKDEIQSGKLLQIDLTGTFGAEQFQK